MKKIVYATLGLCALVLGACGNSEANTSSSTDNGKEDTLVVSTFGLSEDIVKKDIIQPFESENNVKITLDIGNSSDRFTKMKNNPNSGIDVIELAQNNATQGAQDDLFVKLTEENVPNIAQLTDNAKEVLDSGAGVPIAVNSIGIIYDEAKVGHKISDWSDLWAEDLKGKIAIPDISVTAGPLFLYVAGDYAKTPVVKDDGKAAFKALEELKPNIVKTYSKSSDLANMFQSGEVSVAVVADFGVDMIKASTPDATYVVPESGTYANFNTVNIPKTSQNQELALKFINYRISEQSQKTKATSLNEAPTNKEVVLTDEESANKTYGEIANRAKPVDFTLINQQMTSWVDQWNNLMNN